VLAEFPVLRRMKLSLWRTVPIDRRRQPFRHPECGTMAMEAVTVICAGPDLSHLARLRQIS
jgi:hypothetical protein